LLEPARSAGGQRRYRAADAAKVRDVLALVEEGWSRADAARAVASRDPVPDVETSVLDALPDGVVVTDAAYKILYANPALVGLLETTRQELEGGRGFQHVEDEIQGQLVVEAFQALRRGEQLEYDLSVRTGDDGRKVLGVAAGPLLAADGSYRGAVGVLRDVTATREAERQLEFRGRLLDAVGEAIIAMNLDGVVEYWSPSAQAQFGWSAAEVIGHHIRDFAPEEVVEAIAATAAPVRSGVVSSQEVRIRRRDGTPIDVSLTLAPVTDHTGAGGALIGVIAVGVDVTERKRIEEDALARAAQHEVVAALSQWALAEEDVDELLEHAVVGVSRALGADSIAIVERLPGADELRVRASLGQGEDDGTTGRLSRPFRSHAAFTIKAQRPVVVEDFELERRFGRGPFGGERSAASGACVPIRGSGDLRGALCVHATSRRTYAPHEITFLESVANICGLSMHADRMQARLAALAERA
jgi:PAS domain S-box-containing protein